MYYTIPHEAPYNTNHFSVIPKAKTMSELMEKSDYKNVHLDYLNRRYLGNNDEKTEIPDIKYIRPINNYSINECTTST